MYDATQAVELLERAIGYTRSALGDIRPELLCQPTPCRQWRLGPLLTHMADSLDALTEASTGYLPLTPAPATSTDERGPEALLKAKACTLLGAWTSPAARSVLVGGRALDSRILIGAGALEIVVHGWDVSQATGAARPIPEELARALFPIARAVVGLDERGDRFEPPVEVEDGESWSGKLAAYCGRSPLAHHESHR